MILLGPFTTKLDAINARLGSGLITVIAPVVQGGDVQLVRGDDYRAADGRALQWAGNNWPDLAGATIRFIAQERRGAGAIGINQTATVITINDAPGVQVELTATQTAALEVGNQSYRFDLTATLANRDVVTLCQGHVSVLASAEVPHA